MFQSFIDLLTQSGFFYLDWRMIVMWAVVGVLFYLAVKHQFEPLLLIPIAFGALLANLPTSGVINKPAGEIVAQESGVLVEVFVQKEQKISMPRVIKDQPDAFWRLIDEDKATDTAYIQKTLQDYLNEVAAATTVVADESASEQVSRDAMGIPTLVAILNPDAVLQEEKDAWKKQAVTVEFAGNQMEVRLDDKLIWANASGVITSVMQKGKVVKGEAIIDAYDSHFGGLYHYIQMGIILEIFPPLIFLGVGALTDFGPLIANPKTLLLGAAAQFGVFATLFGATFLGFSPEEAASIGIIGGADGPTSIFLSNKLAPHLLAPIAVAAYSYMALVPIIQPPIMRLLTTVKERKIKMQSLRKVSRLEKLIFAIVVTIFCILLVPDASALVGMLMLGNFIRESGVCDRLSKAAQNELINVTTIFLGTSVGITMTGDKFLRTETLSILFLGVIAFIIATGAGLIMAKTMNLFLKKKINPLIGSAGVSAVPMAARVSHVEGQKADPSNFLLMHAMGPNVAGVIGTAVVAGFFISTLAH
ncbi:MAG: sodium ion-translocating decarboxylase subunit beta [Opitutales bacterium]